MPFEVRDAIDLEAEDASGTHGLLRAVTPDSIATFKKSKNAKDYGVYVFGLRSSAVTPWYVGLAKAQTFAKEAMTKDKLRKYSASMFGRTGTPVITLLSWSSPDAKSLIGDLETFLIWVARARNPKLINERKVSTAPKSIIQLVNNLEIKGVLKRGKGAPSNAAKAFNALMGLA